ncbi:hypothetical protein KUCAC02_032820 [Chaenocephalus aceratus]|nr:hypothetical protein KUCAC02_032820 [Chaenocephalus aceratus]
MLIQLFSDDTLLPLIIKSIWVFADEARPKENTEPVLRGSIEAAVKLPVGTKSSGLNNEEDGVPVVAFKERRSLRTLSGLEEIQTHQRAEVI